MGTGPMKEFVTKYRPNYQFPNDAIQNIQATSRTRDAFFSWAVKDPVYIQNYTLEISHVTNMAVNDIPELGFSTHIPEATIAGLRPNQNYQITIYANGYSGARASSRVSIRTESDCKNEFVCMHPLKRIFSHYFTPVGVLCNFAHSRFLNLICFSSWGFFATLT